MEAALAVQFSASRYLTPDVTEASHAAGYLTADFNLSYTAPSGTWSLAGFVRNLNDAAVYTGAFTVPGVFRSLTLANLSAPRTFGVRLNRHFQDASAPPAATFSVSRGAPWCIMARHGIQSPQDPAAATPARRDVDADTENVW